jgi:signal peptidase I
MKKNTPPRRRLWKALLVLGCFVFAAVLLRIFLFDVYAVSKNSMTNTLKDGDKVFVNKMSRHHVHRNDVVVFRWQEETMIKRCIGVAGDTVLIRHDSIFINGLFKDFPKGANLPDIHTPADAIDNYDPEMYSFFGKYWTIDSFGPYIIPAKGLEIPLTSENRKLYRSLINHELGRPFVTPLDIQGHSYQFNKDYLFLVGDNRHASTDSRRYGAVASDKVVGVATMILYSKKNTLSFSRFMKKIT